MGDSFSSLSLSSLSPLRLFLFEVMSEVSRSRTQNGGGLYRSRTSSQTSRIGPAGREEAGKAWHRDRAGTRGEQRGVSEIAW